MIGVCWLVPAEDIYVRGIGDAEEGTRYNVIHVDEELRDPESHHKLGFRGIYVGSGVVTQTGDPAKIRLHDSAQEALPGDRLFPETYEINADFVPHAPKEEIKGTIFNVGGDVDSVGQYQVVVVNRGSENGVEAGNVLAIYQHGDVVKDSFANGLSANLMNEPKVDRKSNCPMNGLGQS